MGRNHLRVLREAPALFEVTALVDATGVVTRNAEGLSIFKSIEDVRDSDYDVAFVATPTQTHSAIASELLKRRKHVLVEKPICSTFAEGRELVALAEANKVRLAVGHVERFNPAVRKLREVIAAGWLGTPIHFSFTRVGGYPNTLLQGNNVILDLAVHDIDVLRSMVGPIKFETSLAHSTWREGIIDTAEIFARSQSGASASLHVNWITPTKIRTIRVTGTRGVCFVDYILQTCELHGGSLLAEVAPNLHEFESFVELYKSSDRVTFGVQKVEPLKAQLEQFHRFITQGEAGDLSLGADALSALLIAERAMAASARHSTPPPARVSALPDREDPWV